LGVNWPMIGVFCTGALSLAGLANYIVLLQIKNGIIKLGSDLREWTHEELKGYVSKESADQQFNALAGRISRLETGTRH
jgi:hypothetical protein